MDLADHWRHLAGQIESIADCTESGLKMLRAARETSDLTRSVGEACVAKMHTEPDKAQTMKAYRDARDAAIQRIATLRAARRTRDGGATPAKTKIRKPSPK